jgi:uncharacterized protein (TIGR03437 family)
MKSLNRIAFYVLLTICAATQAVAGNVFVLPATPFDPSLPVFLDNPLQSSTTLTATTGVVAVLGKPDGSKFYIVSANGTDTILVFNGTLTTVLRRINLGTAARTAALSPDGKRLLVLAGTLHVFDTTAADDAEMALVGTPDFGVNPMDLAVTLDSKRAYILSDDSSRLTAFDLDTNRVAGDALDITGTPRGVAVAPTGVVYVSSTNRLIEIDPATGALRAEIPLNGFPGKPVFTPDGKYALLTNQLPASGLAFLIDLATRQLAGTLPTTTHVPELLLDQVASVDDTTFYAVSASTRELVRITVNPFEQRTTGFPLSNKTNVRAVAVSNEQPQAKYVFVATVNGLSRNRIGTSQVDEQALSGVPGRLQLAGAASTEAPAAGGFRKFNDEQMMAGGSTTQPLIFRSWDANGRPVFNKTVQFSTDTEGVTIETPATQTSMDGYASTRVTVPETPGPITINANVEGLSTPIAFLVTVAGGGGGVGNTGLLMYSGNGQVVPRGFPTEDPLKVRLTDDAGRPLADATVTWAVASGTGIVSPPTSVTDLDGFAEAEFVGQFTPVQASWLQSTVTASVPGFAPVTFVMITVPTIIGGAPAIPLVTLVAPGPGDGLTGQTGQTLAGGVRVTVKAISGTDSGAGIPNVGVSLASDLDPETNPSASCVGEGGAALTDATGAAACDVRFGGVIGGPVLIRIKVGGIAEYTRLLTVTLGPPSLVTILSGNNQSGSRGATLPTALSAEISDGFGHLFPGTAVTWEVVPAGAVTLVNPSAVADAEGRVSAVARLGSTPGPVLVRLHAGTAQAVFTLNVTVNVSTFRKVSGDGQSALIGQAFASPLMVELLDELGQGASGVTVNFTVTSGSATLGTAAPPTDSQGRASTTVTAGGTAGPIVVTATAAGFSVTFNLTALPPGPIVLLQNIRSAISGDLGVSPGGIVAIFGDGVAAGVQGSVVANGGFLIGALPTSLADVEVLFGTTSAPIYSVNNVNGQQFVVVEAPFNLVAPGTVSVTIRAGAGSTTVNNVQVKAYQPGIFETPGPGGQTYAVLTKEDGSYVTYDNPVRRATDRRLRMYVAGLGQTSPALGTNFAGIPGQTVLTPLVIGVNNGGARLISAETMAGVVGVYVVTFEIAADTATGLNRPLAIAIVNASGNLVLFGNPSVIPSIQ